MRRAGRPSAAQRMVQRVPLAPDAGFLPLPGPVGSPPFRRSLTTADPELVRFHAVGDTGGHREPGPQRRVTAAMVADVLLAVHEDVAPVTDEHVGAVNGAPVAVAPG